MRTAADFLERFCLPLVGGGDAVVGKPLSAADVDEMARQLPHATEPLVAIDEARAGVLAELVVRPPALVFDTDELLLCAAIHNLLFLSHPATHHWTVTEGAERRVLESAYVFASQPLSRNRTRVLARHGLLHNVFDVRRYDVKVSWWTGSTEFFGQKPPRRLTTWKNLRRVREEISVADFSELFGEPEVAPVLATLLRRSPLTQLLSVSEESPRLAWEDAVFLLRDAELARAVAYRSIEGESPADIVATPARLAAAFEQMLERQPEEPDVRAVAAFLIYLGALLALGESEATRGTRPNARAKSALLSAVLAPERAGSRPRGLATFFALPAAAAKIDERLGEPPGLRGEPDWANRWDVHRGQVAEALGEGVIASLADRLRRHIPGVPGGVLDSEARA